MIASWEQEHKGVCQMNPQVVKYKNEIQWNTSQYIYIWFALETAVAYLALRLYSWPPSRSFPWQIGQLWMEEIQRNLHPSTRKLGYHRSARHQWFIRTLDPWKITFPMIWNPPGFSRSWIGKPMQLWLQPVCFGLCPANCQSRSRLLQILTRGYCAGRRTLQV